MSDLSKLLTPHEWRQYALLDSGGGRKLEQFGAYRLVRPEPRAVWKAALPDTEWQTAAAVYQEENGGKGQWHLQLQIETHWQMSYRQLQFWVALENSRQVGVFPENAVQWDWLRARLAEHAKPEPVRLLNLFGFTGLASITAAQAGAHVTHVDASRRAVRLGQNNQALNGLQDRPIRWLVDDALKFVQREARRGNRYDALVMDPPKYGLGPKKERWEFSKGFNELCKATRQILSDSPLFVVVTAYALNSPPDVLKKDMHALVKGIGGQLTFGELGLQEKSAGRKISTSIFARWCV